MSGSWKLTLPCTREEAEILQGSLLPLEDMDPQPVLMTSEPDPARPDEWQLDAYFDGRPGAAQVQRIKALIRSAVDVKPRLEKLPDEDWLTLSQQGLDPVIAGRFHVRNHADDPVPDNGSTSFLIPASRAFGTGQHETTSGCLMMLDRMKRLGMRFENMADIGTGTGLLAFAALHLWRQAFALASDIDPVSVDVSAENAALNDVRLGHGQGQLALVVAPGVEHPDIAARAPYDLIIANILAGPLIELAPSLSAHLAEGGTLILAGLLETQMDKVIAAYRHQGLRVADTIIQGDWPTVRLRKRHSYAWQRPRRWDRSRNGEAPGYGTL